MMKKYLLLIPLSLFLLLAAFLGRGLGLDPREVPSPLIGKPAPAFDAPSLDDPAQHISPAQLKGRVWILNVYASWCVACQDEHPVLTEWARLHPGTPLIGLDYKDERPAAQTWLGRLGNPYTRSVFDADGRIGVDWGVYGVPETFVIDKTGVIRLKHIGPLTPEVLRTRIEPLLQRLALGA